MDSRKRILIICLAQFLPDILTGIPIVAPLVCWLFWKDDADPQVADYARRRLNTSISWTIWAIITLLLCSVVIGAFIAIPLLIVGIVAIIKDVIRASKGDTSYKFPLTIQFIPPRNLN